MIMLIDNVKILISYKGSSIEEIFTEICNSNNYQLLGFLSVISQNIKEGRCVCSSIENALFYNAIYTGLDYDDIENIKGFLSMLGKSDVNGQIVNCDLFKKIFNNKLKNLEKDESRKCKTSVTIIMGVCFIFIIFLI